MDFWHILSYGFMQRALLAGLLVSLNCAVLGVFLVLRREAMIGHGLAHVTFGGVALALFLDMAPLPVAVIFSLISSWWINSLRSRAGLGGDIGIGIVSSLSMAIGILLASLAGDFNSDLFSYLFGSILATTYSDLFIACGLGAAVLATLIFFYNELIYSTFDRETAKTAGIPVEGLDMLLTAMTAITVVIGMKVVGLLLVASLMVIPAASGLIISGTFRQAVANSILFASASVIFGLFLSFYLDWPASGTIVVLNGIFLATALGLKRQVMSK